MRWALAAVALVSLAQSPAAATQPSASWPIGVEREVDDGVYVTLLRQENGWRLWRWEERSGVTCEAVKSGIGRPHPVPARAGTILYRGDPWISLTYWRSRDSRTFRGSENVALRGRHTGGWSEWQRAGDRFGTSFHYGLSDLPNWSNERIEIHVVTFRYPALLIGKADQRAMIDMVGLEQIRTAARECAETL